MGCAAEKYNRETMEEANKRVEPLTEALKEIFRMVEKVSRGGERHGSMDPNGYPTGGSAGTPQGIISFGSGVGRHEQTQGIGAHKNFREKHGGGKHSNRTLRGNFQRIRRHGKYILRRIAQTKHPRHSKMAQRRAQGRRGGSNLRSSLGNHTCIGSRLGRANFAYPDPNGRKHESTLERNMRK